MLLLKTMAGRIAIRSEILNYVIDILIALGASVIYDILKRVYPYFQRNWKSAGFFLGYYGIVGTLLMQASVNSWTSIVEMGFLVFESSLVWFALTHKNGFYRLAIFFIPIGKRLFSKKDYFY